MPRATRPPRPSASHAFLYEQCDIPAGMTVRDYQVLRCAERKRSKTGLLSQLRGRRSPAASLPA
jgi:hypothetical protein